MTCRVFLGDDRDRRQEGERAAYVNVGRLPAFSFRIACSDNGVKRPSQRGDKHAERWIPWNGGPTLRRPGLALRDRYGFGVARRRHACANEEISIARLVSIPGSAPEPCGYPCGDGSLISRSRSSEDTGQTWPSILRTGDGTCGARKHCRNRRAVHFTCGWHEPIATEIPHHRIQTMDAQRPCALVVRAPVGIRNVRPLVHPTLISLMNSGR